MDVELAKLEKASQSLHKNSSNLVQAQQKLHSALLVGRASFPSNLIAHRTLASYVFGIPSDHSPPSLLQELADVRDWRNAIENELLDITKTLEAAAATAEEASNA